MGFDLRERKLQMCSQLHFFTYRGRNEIDQNSYAKIVHVVKGCTTAIQQHSVVTTNDA